MTETSPGSASAGPQSVGPLPSVPLRLGTRQSQLALAQSGQMARDLEAHHPGLRVELVPIVTRGDREKGALAAIGGKGLFTQELEEGLREGTLDLAVHSLKDLPVTPSPNLVVAAYPPREDPRDALVSELSRDLDGLPPGAVLLTGAGRRQAQILQRRPDCRVQGIRGNVDTRLRIWKEEGHGGVILAMSGLRRLGLAQDDGELPIHGLDPDVMVPAPGQGTLALQVREGSVAHALCAALNDDATEQQSTAERHVVAALGGDCTLPLAAWARHQDGALHLTAVLATVDGRLAARGEARGDDPVEVAQACLEAMHHDGAQDVLRALGRAP